jgi:oligosaccharyltransferase complex subunit delta (ribophorin II)
VLDGSVDKKVYATGGQTQVPIFITGVIKIDNAEIAVLDSDIGSIEAQKKYVTSSNDFLLFSDD